MRSFFLSIIHVMLYSCLFLHIQWPVVARPNSLFWSATSAAAKEECVLMGFAAKSSESISPNDPGFNWLESEIFLKSVFFVSGVLILDDGWSTSHPLYKTIFKIAFTETSVLKSFAVSTSPQFITQWLAILDPSDLRTWIEMSTRPRPPVNVRC